MKRSSRLLGFLAATSAIVLGVNAPANATFTVTTSQSDFLAGLGNGAEDTFDNLGPGASQVAQRYVGAYDYLALGLYTGTARAGSPSDYFLTTGGASDTLELYNFGTSVTALGGYFFATDASGAVLTTPVTLKVTATDFSNKVTSETLINPTASTFVGFTSTKFFGSILVQVLSSTAGARVTVDDLYLGKAVPRSAVPEMSTWALMILGFGCIGASMRARRRPFANA